MDSFAGTMMERRFDPNRPRPDDPWFRDLEKRRLHIPERFIRGIHIAGDFSQTTQTADYTAGDELVILADATARDIDITLPSAASSDGQMYHVKKIDTTSHKVTIKGDAVGETVDNEKEFEIVVPMTCITVLCDGSDWWVI